MKRTLYIGVMLFFLTSFLWGCAKDAGKGESDTKESEQNVSTEALEELSSKLSSLWTDPESDPYRGQKVFATLDGIPVTEEELERFNQRILHDPGHGQDTKVWRAFPAYVRYFTVYREAEKEGVTADAVFRTRFLALIRVSLAPVFEEWLQNTAPIDPEKIRKSIPSEWTRMNYFVKTYPTEEAALEARSRLEKTVPDERIPEFQGSETGPIFRNSGFFDPWDEEELFKHQPGDLAGPVKTGIGSGLVLVKSRQDLGPQEQAEFMADLRNNLSRQYAEETFSQYKSRRTIFFDEEAIARGISREASGVGLSKEPVVRIDNEKLSYEDFRLLLGNSYQHIWEALPRATWLRLIKGDLQTVVRALVMGMMAEEHIASGLWTPDLPANMEKVIYDYRKTFLYEGYVSRLTSELGSRVKEKELLKYYEENINLFMAPARAKILYSFTKDPGTANIWKEVKEKGGTFDDAANAVVKSGSRHSGLGEDLKSETLFQGDASFNFLQEGLFGRMKMDDYDIIKGDMGHYLFKVQEITPQKPYPFEVVRGDVFDMMINTAVQAELSKRIDTAWKEIEVKILGEVNRPDMRQDLPHPDTG